MTDIATLQMQSGAERSPSKNEVKKRQCPRRIVGGFFIVAFLFFTSALPWLLAGNEAIRVCTETSSRIFAPLIDNPYPWLGAHFLPSVFTFLSSSLCWAFLLERELYCALAKKTHVYFAVAALVSCCQCTMGTIAHCSGGAAEVGRAGKGQERLIPRALESLCSWSLQIVTSLLLHDIIIQKVRLQRGHSKWLRLAVFIQACLVCMYSIDVLVLFTNWGEYIDEHVQRGIAYFAVFFVAHSYFTVSAGLQLLMDLSAAQQALHEGQAMHGNAQLAKALRRLRKDALSAVVATFSGVLSHFCTLLFFIAAANGPLGRSGRGLLSCLHWTGALRSLVNNIAVLLLAAPGWRPSRAMDRALAEEQRRVDAMQQVAFARACAAFELAPPSRPLGLQLAALEHRIRRRARDAGVVCAEEDWKLLRAECAREHMRLKDLETHALTVYQTLACRYLYVFVVPSQGSRPRFQGLPGQTAKVRAHLDKDGEALVGDFRRLCESTMAEFNSAQGLEDLGLGADHFVLPLDHLAPISRASGASSRSVGHAPTWQNAFVPCRVSVSNVTSPYFPEERPFSLKSASRTTLVFTCPYHLAVFVAFSRKRFEVVQVENGFRDSAPDSEHDVVLGVSFGLTGISLVFEVQLCLDLIWTLRCSRCCHSLVLWHAKLNSFMKSDPVFHGPFAGCARARDSAEESCEAEFALPGTAPLGVPIGPCSLGQQRDAVGTKALGLPEEPSVEALSTAQVVLLEHNALCFPIRGARPPLACLR